MSGRLKTILAQWMPSWMKRIYRKLRALFTFLRFLIKVKDERSVDNIKSLTDSLIQERYIEVIVRKPRSFFDRIPKEAYPEPGPDGSKKPFFVHIHLPRTGGTTFNTVLEKNFKCPSDAPHGIPKGYEQLAGRFLSVMLTKLSCEQMRKFIEIYTDHINCVASHNISAILPYQDTPRRIVAIAFVRDPVDRLFSSYFHLRFFGGNFVESKLGMDDYIRHRTRGGARISCYLINLAGEESEDSFKYIQKLVENEHLYLFNTYRMQEAFKILKAKFPGYFKDTEIKVENASKKDQEVTDKHREKVLRSISLYDLRLVELANVSMDRMLAQCS